MTANQDWTPTSRKLPPEGVVVQAMDSSGHVQELVYYRRLWFFPDYSMYIYFVPTCWRLTDATHATTR